MNPIRVYRTARPHRHAAWADAVILLGVTVVLYAGVRLAFYSPPVVRGPEITLAPSALPWYALLSVARMGGAYALSLLFALAYGYKAAQSQRAGKLLLPLLDVLQSVPILSFLPVVVLSLTAFLPERMALELSAVLLIFTSQAWNLAFAWYQSLTTVPKELDEARAVFRLSPWLRLRALLLPFGGINLIWNSMMSWAGGWFFLMAAEMFTVGTRDFRLPGLGAYLHEAAERGDIAAIGWGIGTLGAVIVLLDQLLWRPLLAWSDRFKLETVEGEAPPTSWFYNLVRGSRVSAWTQGRVVQALGERLEPWLAGRRWTPTEREGQRRNRGWVLVIAGALGGGALLFGTSQAVRLLAGMPLARWGAIVEGAGATFLRVFVALGITLAWTVPVGVAIGRSRRLARWLAPLVQIAASVPATALFPVFVLALVGLPGGLNLAAVLLMLAGTQWYVLFNVIAGTRAIPQDLKNTAEILGLSRWGRWRTLILPALFPYLVTGMITASGGAWNASIVAERVEFGGRTLATPGLGAVIAAATAAGDYPLLLGATLVMILAVVLVNRVLWRRMYRRAEERYKLE